MNEDIKTAFIAKIKKLPLRWLIFGCIVAVIVIIGFIIGGGNEEQYTLAKVEKGNIVQTVEVSGELESYEEAQLAFESSGTVSRVFVQAGDNVSEGQVLAILESSEILADLSAYQQALFLAQANLEQFTAGATEQDIAASYASLQSAQADLVSKQELAVLNVDAAQTALEYAQDDYDNTIVENDEDILESYEDLRTILFSCVIDIRSALSSADEILGIENTIYNDAFEDVLSATDPQALTSAVYNFEHAAEARDLAEDLVYALSEDSSQDDIDNASDAVYDAILDTSTTLLYTRRVLDATTSDTPDLSLADVSAFKTTVDAERDTIQSELSAFVAQRQIIASLAISIDDAEEYAQNILDTKQQAYDQAISNASSSVAIAQAAVDVRQAEYDVLISDKRSVDLAPYYAQIGQAQAQMSSAEARLRKTEIRSPFDGIVTNIDISIGEPVGIGQTVVGVQSSSENYKVLVDVPESDIVKLALEDEAIITFDAYGDDVEISGYVGRINPGEDDIEGVVYYRVEIYLSDGYDLTLKSGMSSDIIITTNTKDDVLFVQQRGVYEYDDGTKYVKVPVGDSFEERVIETGMRADGGRVEIISGLEEGDEIITAINN
jgi:RND family efflux transporter MFP subunit